MNLPSGTMLFSAVDRCRLCGDGPLDPVFDLGRQALTGRFPHPDDPPVPTGPLELVRCTACGLLQLAHDYDPAELFGDAYGYRSGVNATMRAHLAAIAREAADRVPLAPGDTVLDIGSNDGTLLAAYGTPGLVRIGMDPCIARFAADYGDGMVPVRGLFDADRFDAVATGRAKVVTSVAMFYDLPDPNRFAADVAQVLSPDGVWVLEQSYAPLMLERNAFDTVCHEHVAYYALAQIDHVMERNGLRIIDVGFNDINGGSVRVTACHGDARFPVSPSVAEALARERGLALETEAPYAAFRQRVETVRAGLGAFIRGETAAGKSVYVYGASTKGNVLLQSCGLDHRVITAAADRNPEKWGRRTPATDIPIVSEQTARDARPDYFLVLPWHFRDEFLAREQAFRAAGGRMVFPLPELEVV